MRKLTLAALLCLALTATLAAGCGGGDDGPLEAEELAQEADDVCTEANDRFAVGGVRGIGNEALADEFEFTSEVVADRQEQLEALEPADDAAKAYETFLAASEDILAGDRAIAKAAAEDDTKGVNDGFAKLDEASRTRERAAEELGMEVCGQIEEPRVEETGTGPADDLAYPEPENTVAEAAEAFLAAAESDDCKRINAEEHSDNGTLSPQICAAIADTVSGAEILLSEQYGPAGAAEIVTKEDQPITLYFAVDRDGMLRHGGDVTHDSGGLRPANDDNDADAKAEAVVEAIRENDPEAFEEASGTDSTFELKGDGLAGSSPSGKALVADIRADDEAAPEPLGINQAFAFYLLEANGNHYVLGLTHNSGAGGDYGFNSYFPIPSP